MSLHPDINALFVQMGYRWVDACEILAAAKEASQDKPVPLRSELPAMISKLGAIEHDTMALLSTIQEAKRLLNERYAREGAKAIDVLANMEPRRAVA